MRATRVLAIAAILGIAFSFRVSANVVYDSETTNEWFSVNMSTLTKEKLQSSPWTPPKDGGEATVEAAVIKLDTDLDDPLTYTAKDSEDVAIVAAEMTATVNASEPDLKDVPQAALCVIGTETATNWVGLVGTTENDKGYKWETFQTPVPVAGETYSVRIEFDQRQGQSRRIRYRVGDAVLGDWYPNPQKDVSANIKSVSFSGTGDISGLGGSNVVANAATFNGTGYATVAEAIAEAEAAGSAWSASNPVVLYADATYEATATKSVFFNANGHVLTITGGVYKQNGVTYEITVEADCEAKIGSTFYATFDEAVAAAGANDVVIVNRAKILTEGLTVAKSYGLNPDGKLTCATLTVNAGATLTLAGDLAVTTATINGSVAGAGILTVTGTLTGVNVAKLTLGDNATFAFAGTPLAAATLGTALNVTGLSQAEIGATIVSSGAADSTTFTSDLPTGKCLEVENGQLKVASVAKITEVSEDEGFDYTNGTVNVTATVKSGTATAELTVVGWDGATVKTATKSVTSGTAMTWDVADVLGEALTQGGVYTYTVDIKMGGEVVATKSGEFTAANWGDDIWFGADASKPEADQVKGGSWVKTPTIDSIDKVYVIEEDSIFNVTEQELGSNRVTRVDAKVTYESLVDGEVDVPEDNAIGGFVATTEGWKALTMVQTDAAWVTLKGGAEPVADKPYVIRAEVDFISVPKRVRYLVSEDDGVTFIPLFNGTAQWIALANTTKSLLAKVELQGSGRLAKFEARVADKAIAEVDGVEYDTMEDALAAAGTEGTNTIKLLTNATVEPDLDTPGKYAIAPNNHEYMSGGKVSYDAKTIIVEGSGKPPVVRVNDQEMQKVMTPDGKSYKNYDSLRKFLEKNKVEGYTNDNANAESVSNALEVTGANSLKIWQDYALGIDVGTPIAPVTTPAGDTNKDNITLAIPAIDTAKYSGDYTISYQVKKGAAAVGNPSDKPSEILIPLTSGTGTYMIKAVFAPKASTSVE